MTTAALGIVFVTIALDLIGFGMVVPLMPLYAQTYAASATQIAWLLAIYSLMQFIFAPLWGRLSDRVGRRPVLLCSIAGNIGCLLLFAHAPNYTWLLIARMASGICTANIAVANACVADLTTDANRARGMGLVGAAFGLGFVIGPFLGGELSQMRWGAVTPIWVAALLGLGNFVWAYKRLPETRPSFDAHKRSAWGLQNRWEIARIYDHVRPLYWIGFIQILGFAMMEMALTLFSAQRLGFDAAQCGRLFAYVGIVLCIVQGGLVGRLTKRFGEIHLIAIGLAAIAVGLLSIPAAHQPHVWWILLPMTLLAFGQGLLSPCLSSLLSRSVPKDQQGAALGLLQSLSALARVLGPWIAGLLVESQSIIMPFVFGGALLTATCFLARIRLRDWAMP